MSETTIYVRGTRAEVRRTLARLPQAARGDGEIARAMMVRLGLTLLGRIRTAFVTKARGGTDEAGDRWPPLSPKTIAYSRRGRTATERGRQSRPSQALASRQRDRWWDLYRRGLAMYRGDKGHAAARAWTILKSEGATTLLQKYGNRQVEILRDTGLLLNSLSPGVDSGDQVFRVTPGSVIVGTNRKGAIYHHLGIPGRLPQRRLWPPISRWPANWWRDLEEQARQGLIDITLQLLRGL